MLGTLRGRGGGSVRRMRLILEVVLINEPQCLRINRLGSYHVKLPIACEESTLFLAIHYIIAVGITLSW